MVRNLSLLIIFLISFIVMFSGCKNEKIDEDVSFDNTPYILNYGNLPAPQIPDDNVLTKAGVELGRMLFYDKRLSGDESMACANCHKQEFAFTDTAKFSIGIDGLPGKRQAMAAFNTLWHTNEFFWDGRAHLLRDQALMPIQDPLEMHETLENVVAKLSIDQKVCDQFIRAFGSPNITSEKVALALEQFMHSIVSSRSKYDKYLAGEINLTESEERGRELFFAEYNPFFPDLSGADCNHCHSGNNFENNKYMNNGLYSDIEMIDFGREAVTGNPADKGKFKVPSLRNVEVTFPYMHDGSLKTLEEVINHYNSDIHASTTLEIELENTRETGLFLDEADIQDLIAFLKTLTDTELLNDARYSSPFE